MDPSVSGCSSPDAIRCTRSDHQNCIFMFQPQQMRSEELTIQVQQRPKKTTMSTRIKEQVSHRFVDDGGEEHMKRRADERPENESRSSSRRSKTIVRTDAGTCVDKEAPGPRSSLSLALANAGRYESRRQANACAIGCSALHPNIAG